VVCSLTLVTEHGMDTKEAAIIAGDMNAFIMWCGKNNKPAQYTVFNVLHDVSLLENGRPGVPRTKGYMNIIKEEAANEKDSK